MIPKVIHFCWLSNDPYPELISKCMNTWKVKLRDYEFVLWDTNRFDLESTIWVQQAFETKKYAFAADYIRLYAIYNFGGIYMDTDIEVVKSFNDLLHLKYFVGSEGDGIIEAGVFGAEKGSEWLADCLNYYAGKKFINDDGTCNTLTLPRIMMKQIQSTRTIRELAKAEIVKIQYLNFDETKLHLFPKDFFCAKNHETGQITKTENTYSIHHFAMSWIPNTDKFLPNFKRKLMAFFGVKTISFFINLFSLKKIRDRFLKE